MHLFMLMQKEKTNKQVDCALTETGIVKGDVSERTLRSEQLPYLAEQSPPSASKLKAVCVIRGPEC